MEEMQNVKILQDQCIIRQVFRDLQTVIKMADFATY